MNTRVRAGGVFARAEMVALYLAATLVAVLLVLTCAEVVHRLLRGGSLRGVIEVSEVMLVPVVYLAVASAERSGTHVNTRIVIDRIPRRWADLLYRIAMVPVIVVFAWMSYELAGRSLESFTSGEYRFGLARVPVWPGRAVLLVGITLLTLELIRSVVRGTTEASEDAVSGPQGSTPGGGL